MALFANRRQAGRILGERLMGHVRDDVVVLGLPRGGVPVAYEVAEALRAPLDVFIVRKLGVPGDEECAMGAIASGGVRVIAPRVVESLGIAPWTVDAVVAREQAELERRERLYRGGQPAPAVRGRTAIIVDDGVATGASMLAAVQAARALGARAVVAAAPVMSRDARAAVLRAADACESIASPEPFGAVGLYYADFTQTEDEEVLGLLAASRKRSPRAAAGRVPEPAGGPA